MSKEAILGEGRATLQVGAARAEEWFLLESPGMRNATQGRLRTLAGVVAIVISVVVFAAGARGGGRRR